MLPFTKRPGRAEESGDEHVVTKDDVAMPASASSSDGRPPSKRPDAVRANFISVGDEDMTKLMAAKSLGDARPSPRPAAGAPAPRAQSSRPGSPVPSRPRIVKRNSGAPNSSPGAKMGMPTLPTTVSPAAVIKASLESARAGGRTRSEHGHLMAGPPADLLEDLDDLDPTQAHEHTAILQPSNSSSQIPPSVRGHSAQMLQSQAISRAATAAMASASQSGGYAAQSGGYAAHYSGGLPPSSVNVAGGAMSPSLPAHFMVAQGSYSDARIDPPATAVTARTKVAGRPATSWAIAVAAFGLFVGVGAVAAMNGHDGSMIETSASFVDPSRAGGGKAAAAQQATPDLASAEQPVVVGAPPVAVPATAEAVTAPVVTTPAAAVPGAAPRAVAAAPAVAPAPKPAPVVAAAPRPAPPPVVRAVRPAAPPPAPADETVAAASATTKTTKAAKAGAKGAGDSAVDEEQRKALKALQESQLETPF